MEPKLELTKQWIMRADDDLRLAELIDILGDCFSRTTMRREGSNTNWIQYVRLLWWQFTARRRFTHR